MKKMNKNFQDFLWREKSQDKLSLVAIPLNNKTLFNHLIIKKTTFQINRIRSTQWTGDNISRLDIN